jgi:heme/copper-type cytochrome/quinol oxidase subunit 2
MDVVGYILFGLIFLVIGVLLYIPGRWWAKRKLRNAPPNSEYNLHITSSGLALCVLMVFTLVIGSSQRYLAPESEFGRFVSNPLGLLFFWAAVTVATIVFGLVLEMLGFTLYRRPNRDEPKIPS